MALKFEDGEKIEIPMISVKQSEYDLLVKQSQAFIKILQADQYAQLAQNLRNEVAAVAKETIESSSKDTQTE